MAVRLVVALWCLAGCDVLLRLDRVRDPVVDAPHVDAPLADATNDGPPVDAPQCPASYNLRFGSSWYRHSKVVAPWASAEQLCEADSTAGILRRTHLAVLTDESERMGMISALQSNGSVGNAWIGLSDRKTENTFKWVTAEPIGTPPKGQTPPWSPGQPDNNSTQVGGQDCVRIVTPGDVNGGLLDDVECIANFEFVCECDDYPAVAANF